MEKNNDEFARGLFDRFKKPEWKDENPNVMLEAIKRMYDNKILAEIAKNDPDPKVRFQAVKNISNQSVLADVANNSSDIRLQKRNTKMVRKI